MPSQRPSDPQLIIVGAGPVGLCLANLAAGAGIETMVLEAEPAIVTDLRASTFHPPTLDMLEALGVTETLLAQGVICPSWQVRLHPSGERAVFDMSVLADDTRHPYRLQCEQWKLSLALHARLQGEGQATLRFGARVVDVRAGDAAVSVDIETAHGRETVSARYVVGCDGARSMVRGASNIPFDGLTYPETTILATTRFRFEDYLEGISNVSYCWKEGGNFSLLKVPERWRVSIYPREDVSIEDQLAPASIEASLQEIVPRAEPFAVLEARPYRVHMRIVPTYRRSRVLLAGDAAHVNAPAGGMGLNGGIHDAFCLAECLVEVLKHGGGDDRLDRYDRRRRPVAHDEILAQADRNRARMREKDPARRRELLADLQAICADRTRLAAYLRRSSMIDGLRRAAQID
ncbi:MAG TPA: NAD(P)/FAD-dependent oxidoreductase [Stellaceae bacterium]